MDTRKLAADYNDGGMNFSCVRELPFLPKAGSRSYNDRRVPDVKLIYFT